MKIKSWVWYLITAVAAMAINILILTGVIPVVDVGSVKEELIKDFAYGFLEFVFIVYLILTIIKKMREIPFPSVVFTMFSANVIFYLLVSVVNDFPSSDLAKFLGCAICYVVIVAGYYIIKITKEKRWKELL